MADEELRAIIGDEEPKPLEVTPEKKEEPKEDPELKKKREEKANLDKAIEESKIELKRIRGLKKDEKGGKSPEPEEEIPVIDDKDPGAKAWNQRIRETVAPGNELLERAKEERRNYALRRFLSDKPALASNPEKLKETMAMYERVKSATELTTEGILEDLDRAYGATHYREISGGNSQERIEKAREDMIYADPGVTRGSTTYSEEKPKKRAYSEEERDILKTWEKSGAPVIE